MELLALMNEKPVILMILDDWNVAKRNSQEASPWPGERRALR